MATYDIVQTVEMLNFAANGASNIAATQSALQGYLQAYLNGGTDPINTQYAGFFPQMNSQLAGGDWSVVWGPCVYSVQPESSSAYAANAMYVAYSKNLSTYVVAIAATNPTSVYDWIDEDGDVSPFYMAPWPLALPFAPTKHGLPTPGSPYISAATALGVSNLLTKMADPVNGSLQSFLTKTANSNDTLIFTGHSLAGALAPTTALYLYPKPNQSGWKQIFVLPTAGASPGNHAFANLFAAAYPQVSSGVDAPYGNWNTDYANANDVVPHAWNRLGQVVSSKDAAGNYPSIFGVLDPTMGSDLTLALDGAQALSMGSLYYMNLTMSQFTPSWGTWSWTQNQDGSWQYPPEWVAAPQYTDANPLSTTAQLGQMILATHIDQYSRFFNITPPPRMPSSLPNSESTPEALRKQVQIAAAKVS